MWRHSRTTDRKASRHLFCAKKATWPLASATQSLVIMMQPTKWPRKCGSKQLQTFSRRVWVILDVYNNKQGRKDDHGHSKNATKKAGQRRLSVLIFKKNKATEKIQVTSETWFWLSIWWDWSVVSLLYWACHFGLWCHGQNGLSGASCCCWNRFRNYKQCHLCTGTFQNGYVLNEALCVCLWVDAIA